MRLLTLLHLPSRLGLRAVVGATLAACVLAAATTAHAVPITGLYTTGVDNLGVPLAGGAVDPHYKLIASDDANFPGPNAIVVSAPLPGIWTPNIATAKWIAPRADQIELGNAAGTYIYRLTFDLGAGNPVGSSLTGLWATDNVGLIFLNGVYTGNTNLLPPNTVSGFSITSNFVAGINHLDFVVVNSSPGPTGLIVERLIGDTPGIPEPSSIVLAALGCAGLVGLKLRRRAK